MGSAIFDIKPLLVSTEGPYLPSSRALPKLYFSPPQTAFIKQRKVTQRSETHDRNHLPGAPLNGLVKRNEPLSMMMERGLECFLRVPCTMGPHLPRQRPNALDPWFRACSRSVGVSGSVSPPGVCTCQSLRHAVKDSSYGLAVTDSRQKFCPGLPRPSGSYGWCQPLYRCWGTFDRCWK